MQQFRKILIICFALLWGQSLCSQNIPEEVLLKMKRFHILSEENINKNHAGNFLLNKCDTLDMCQMRIIYDVSALRDTQHNRREQDQVVLQLGSRWQKFYGLTKWKQDTNTTLFTQGKPQISYPDMLDLVIDYEIYRNNQTDTLINQHALPFMTGQSVVFHERSPLFDWQITTEIKQIAGYGCQCATTHFAGRDWVVWFTTSIPVNGGLWKFSGLPGLILEATDQEGHYRFTINEITQSNEPILFYRMQTKNMTPDEWRKLAKRVYNSPIESLGRNGEEGFIVRDSKTNGMKLLDEDWEMPYNPIERE